MKVQQAIEMLTKYFDPTDDLIIAWWDKEIADAYAGQDQTLTDAQWLEVVEELDTDETLFHTVNDDLTEAINKAIAGTN
jgi:hypothetical protein